MVLNGLKTSSNSYGEEVVAIAKNRSQAPAATWDDEESFSFQIDTSWGTEVTHFFDSIKNDTAIKFGSSDDALRVMKLIGRVYQNERKVSETLYDNLQQ